MSEVPRKKRWGWLKREHSDPHSQEEGGRSEASRNNPSSLPPSRAESRTGPRELVRKMWGKVIKRRSTRGVGRSSNPEPVATSYEQDPSPVTVAPTPEANPDWASNSGVEKVHHQTKQPDPNSVNERIVGAAKGLAVIGRSTGIVQDPSATNNQPSVPDTNDAFSAILRPLKVFSSIVNELANLHPYAKVALSIFACASNMILDQADRDVAVSLLLLKISQVYAFVTEEEALTNIQSMLTIYGTIARQTLECADFITHYSETKSVWIRLGKHVFNETDATIQNYSDVLDSLMQQFRDRAARDTVVVVHRIAENLDLNSMEYAAGAGVNMSKCCLPDTRRDLLTEIEDWICSTEEGVPSVLWLSGPAGKGKSAVAHTITNWYTERGGLASCFCFDRTQQADRCPDKIFMTIASDLADCNPIMRRALAQAVHDKNGLKRTRDLTRQWREFVVGPTRIASKAITSPVLIVIDALDESGSAKSREQILRLLAGELKTSSSQLPDIPANFRILVTSRPLEDIHDVLDAVSHIRRVSMDNISPVSTERDIQLYVSTMLAGTCSPFDDGHFKTLAQKSDGLFEWARLACEYIKGTNRVGLDPIDRFEAVVTGTSGKGTRLLDDMYRHILAEIMPEDERGEAIPVFRSVMGQILASLEPLPVPALTAMRLHFSPGADRYKVHRVVGPLGSLLTGTGDSQTPIRPLHASFYDFLTDKSRGHDFFVDVTSVQSDLAFASLRVMERGLRFSICSLESSYLPNSAVPELEKRVKDSIPSELSYSCRFWGTHVGATSFQPLLAKEVEAFFDGERLLFWLEALALMKGLSGSVSCLSSIADWFTGHAKYTYIGDAARDNLRFVRTFAATILHSTPHLYLSALPFAPTQSRIFRNFAPKFSRIPRVVAGNVMKWPLMEKILHGHSPVRSVVMSPDAKRIACGLFDGTIQVWDAETCEEFGAPFHGHTDCVASVAFSLDGNRIVSGSWDETVRVWDAATGKALCAPLRGHTNRVQSVTISSDGNCIVSGSWDMTLWIWDGETGEALCSPLRGHTSYVRSVAITPDGKRIVSGSHDKTIRVWDLKTGKTLGTPLQGHTGSVHSVAISPGGNRIVSGSDDKTIRVWDMDSGEALGAPLQGHTGSIQSVAFSSDGNRIVSGSFDKTIRVWDAENGEALGAPLHGHTDSVQSVAISPDGNQIVSGSFNKTIRVWDTHTSTSRAFDASLRGHIGVVLSVAISPDGDRIVSGSADKSVHVWDMETGKPLVDPLQGHTGSVHSVAISPDGNHIVSGSDDKTIRVWDVETGRASGVPLQGHTGRIVSIAISSDGNRIVSGSSDQTIRLWDMRTGNALGAPLQGHTDWVLSVAISLDGKRIVSGSADTMIRMWNAWTGEASGAPLRGHTDWVRSVTISADAQRIVSGSDDNTIRVWDAENGKALRTLRGHTHYVLSIAISPDGHHIVSGSSDKTIRVWDMETGALYASLRGHTASVQSVAISRDGKRIVSGSDAKTIRVWDLEFLHWHHPFTAPAICFSPTPTHALYPLPPFSKILLPPPLSPRTRMGGLSVPKDAFFSGSR